MNIDEPVSHKNIFQARQNFGVNFGSVFVLEKWIFGEMFIDNTGYELDAITHYVAQHGLDATRAKMEDHWNNYVNDSDWQWLQSVGVQSIRLPIGYWVVGGGRFNGPTAFSAISGVYANAWTILKEKYVQKAAQYHISVLVDLHAVEKGANTGDHSGQHFDSPGFWNDSAAQAHTCDILRFMATELNAFENVAGIQVVNEAVFDNAATGQKSYYAAAHSAITQSSATMPVVISDGWWSKQFADWVQQNGGSQAGYVIDNHVYRCYDASDTSKSVDQLTTDLDTTVLGDSVTSEADFNVGEYSCVLAQESWQKTSGDHNAKVVAFGNKEVALFKQKAAGYYFWTYKFGQGDGGEWGFQPMVNLGAIPHRATSINLPSDADFNSALDALYNAHVDYWNRQNPNAPYEHWRYKDGYGTAWYDSLAFARYDNSRIGRVIAWTQARRAQHVREKGNSDYIWEWEQGFAKGLEYWANR